MSTAKNYDVIFSSGHCMAGVCVYGCVVFRFATLALRSWPTGSTGGTGWSSTASVGREIDAKIGDQKYIWHRSKWSEWIMCLAHVSRTLPRQFDVRLQLTAHFPCPHRPVKTMWVRSNITACHKLESNFYFSWHRTSLTSSHTHTHTDDLIRLIRFYLYISGCSYTSCSPALSRWRRWNEYTARQHICNGDYWRMTKLQWMLSSVVDALAVKIECERILRVRQCCVIGSEIRIYAIWIRM